MKDQIFVLLSQNVDRVAMLAFKPYFARRVAIHQIKSMDGCKIPLFAEWFQMVLQEIMYMSCSTSKQKKKNFSIHSIAQWSFLKYWCDQKSIR